MDMDIEDFAKIYCQYRAGSPPIPYGMTPSEVYRDQIKLWDEIHFRAYVAVLKHKDAILERLQTTDALVLARELSHYGLERRGMPDQNGQSASMS